MQNKWTDEDVKRLAKALRSEMGTGCPVFSKKMILAIRVIVWANTIFGGSLVAALAASLIARP